MCGIFGIFNHKDAANMTYLGLHALQHRGQESAGIASVDDNIMKSHREMGLVSDIFSVDVLAKLSGSSAIGHVRYSTTGSSNLGNAQPLVVEYSKGYLAVAHNGNLTNARIIKKSLEQYGSIFQSTSDTEIIIHLIARSQEDSTVERFISAIRNVEGAFSMLILTGKELIAARDPLGFRPLTLGMIKKSYVISSETCAFDLIGAEPIREIEPGEVVVINKEGLQSYKPFKKQKRTYCVFESIYFARPDSFMFGKTVYNVRKDLGRQLARQSTVNADMVIPIPDSGISAAIGYSQETGVPFEMGLIRNHYVGRTFIEPKDSIRHFGVKLKLNGIRDTVKGKNIVVIDDSIVRATTGRKIIKMLRRYGAKKIHFKVSAPPTTYPCFYGIDTPSRAELIASTHTMREINTYMGSDTLEYLAIESLKNVFGNDDYHYCDACFSGNYPSKFPRGMELGQMELFSKGEK